jgi:hypothetical protein
MLAAHAVQLTLLGGFGCLSVKNFLRSRLESWHFLQVYTVFITVAVSVYHWIAESEVSSLLTLSAICQCLAFSLLVVDVRSTGSYQGISAKSLQLQAVAVACRLSSTSWLQGYLPNDKTGDFLYQSFDVLSLAMVLWLLPRVLEAQRGTHDDVLSVTPCALGSFVLAWLVHADLDDMPIFDILWMCGLFVGALAMLPQLWLMARTSANVPAVMNHFVAVTAFSCILSGSFFYIGWPYAVYVFLAAHAVHLTLLAGFGCLSVKNFATQGLRSPLEPENFLQV